MNMSKTQYVIIAGAIVLVVLMFLLPKVVVTKDENENITSVEAPATVASTEDEHAGHDHAPGEGHGAEEAHSMASPEQLKEISALRAKYNQEQSQQAKLKLADELGEKYSAAGKFDSAGYFYEVIAAAKPGERAYEKAAEQYYEAFTFAATQERANELGGKVRELYENVLKNNPSNLDAKTNMAMTYIAGNNPMKGVTMLREVIAADPRNEKALFNLGILSIQSGQYDKAVERFRVLEEVNPKNVSGQFYLGVSLAETGKDAEAIKVFERVKQLDNDPALHASVDEYLNQLKSK